MLFGMPRPLRIHVPGGFYHATLRGNHRQDIFRLDSERVLLNKIVERALEKHRARLHAYCWMTNHLHLLVQVGDVPLGRLMRQIGSEYARAFQLSIDTTGHLFENRYYATLIDTDAYLLEALRYVHQNPVRAGIVQIAAHYRWSSHHTYVDDGFEPWVTTDATLAQFSNDRNRALARYRAFIDETPPADIANELATMETGVPLLGKPAFLARHAPKLPSSATLESIVADACRHFAVNVDALRSPIRTARLVAARAWIAHTATRNSAATMSAIARALKRNESTLRSAMRKHGKTLEGCQGSPVLHEESG